MSLLPKLRITKTRSDILNVLTEIYVNNSVVLIWQRDKNKKRFINTAVVSHIDRTGGCFLLQSTSGDWLSQVNPSLPLYFKGEEQEVLFKVSGVQLSNKHLLVPVPQDVHITDKRKYSRIQPENNKNFIVQNAFKNGKRKQFSLKAIDISQSGAALSITSTDSKFFYEGDSIVIAPSTQTHLGHTVEGRVIYMKAKDDIGATFKGKELRLGIKFNMPITSDHLSCFN